MNIQHTFEEFISFDDIVLAATLGTKKMTPESVAVHYAIWDTDNISDALNSVNLLLENGASFNKDYVTKTVKNYYAHNISKN